jgi:hypothetical protein
LLNSRARALRYSAFFLAVIAGLLFAKRPHSPDRDPAAIRDPAGYIPRASELREDLLKFEARIQGSQQDILDLDKFRIEIRRVLQDFRRAYPHDPIPAEAEVLSLEAALNPVFAFFASNLRPHPNSCRLLIESINRRYLKESPEKLPTAEDSDLAERLVRKLCRL